MACSSDFQIVFADDISNHQYYVLCLFTYVSSLEYQQQNQVYFTIYFIKKVVQHMT